MIIGLMSALEIAVFPGLERKSTVDWVVQVALLVISAIGVVAAVTVVGARVRPLQGAIDI
jgi:hypothetical protein